MSEEKIPECGPLRESFLHTKIQTHLRSLEGVQDLQAAFGIPVIPDTFAIEAEFSPCVPERYHNSSLSLDKSSVHFFLFQGLSSIENSNGIVSHMVLSVTQAATLVREPNVHQSVLTCFEKD
eukprot:2463827-Amphidinium_carterae.1